MVRPVRPRVGVAVDAGELWRAVPGALRTPTVPTRLHRLGFDDLESYLRDRYVDQRASLQAIARELSACSRETVLRALHAYQIPQREWRTPRRYRSAPAEVPPPPCGHLPDGTPYYAPLGTLEYDEDLQRVRCHLCARWMRWVNHTHLATHGWTREEYLEAFGLSWGRALHTPELAEHRRTWMRMALATDPRLRKGLAVGQEMARRGQLVPLSPRRPSPLETRLHVKEGQRSDATLALHRKRREAAVARQLREEQEDAAAHGFVDFPSYWRARRAAGWTLVQIGRELGRHDPWIRLAMAHVEGRAHLTPEEAVHAHTTRRRAALAAAEQRARGLGFATLSDYLVERRGRGWGQKRTALELGVGFKMVRAALLLCGLEPIPGARPSMPRSRRTG